MKQRACPLSTYWIWSKFCLKSSRLTSNICSVKLITMFRKILYRNANIWEKIIQILKSSYTYTYSFTSLIARVITHLCTNFNNDYFIPPLKYGGGGGGMDASCRLVWAFSPRVFRGLNNKFSYKAVSFDSWYSCHDARSILYIVSHYPV